MTDTIKAAAHEKPEGYLAEMKTAASRLVSQSQDAG
jgi:hypothetical protein